MRIVYEPDGDVLEGSADWAKAVDIDLGAVPHLDSGSRLAAIEIFGAVGDERNGQAGARCSQACCAAGEAQGSEDRAQLGDH